MKTNLQKLNAYFDLTGDLQGQLFFYGMLIVGGFTGIIAVIGLILGGIEG